MARKRNELGEDASSIVRALMASGGTAKSIAAALRAKGIDASPATIGRRMKELRGKVRERKRGNAPPPPAPKGRAKRAPSVPVPPLPTSPDEIEGDTPLETINAWIETAEEIATLAKKDGNLPVIGQMGRLVASLLEAKRKATPPTPPDPNDNPDMVALGAKVAEQMHKYVDFVLGR